MTHGRWGARDETLGHVCLLAFCPPPHRLLEAALHAGAFGVPLLAECPAYGVRCQLEVGRVEDAVEEVVDLVLRHVVAVDPDPGDEDLLVEAEPTATDKDEPRDGRDAGDG